ncbi:MAG TPA: orotate phosphoribosyltransferase [Chthoniobacterales bacterium]
MSEEILSLFKQTNALLEGHFVLRSGLHSRQFFQCALLLQHPLIAAEVCGQLAEKLRHIDANTVISPALGGLIVGHEIGRALGKKHIFAEKENGALVLRRGFEIRAGERFLVIEDVVTKGGRVSETIAIVKQHGGIVAAVGTLVDRSGDQTPDFSAPFVSLLKLHVETWPADALPPDLAAIPLTRPGSK